MSNTNVPYVAYIHGWVHHQCSQLTSHSRHRLINSCQQLYSDVWQVRHVNQAQNQQPVTLHRQGVQLHRQFTLHGSPHKNWLCPQSLKNIAKQSLSQTTTPNTLHAYTLSQARGRNIAYHLVPPIYPGFRIHWDTQREPEMSSRCCQHETNRSRHAAGAQHRYKQKQ